MIDEGSIGTGPFHPAVSETQGAQRFRVWEATPLSEPRVHHGKHRVDCEMVKASDYDAIRRPAVPVQDAPPKAWVLIGPAEQQGQGSMWACTKCGAAIQRHEYPEPEAECEFCEPLAFPAVQDALTTPCDTCRRLQAKLTLNAQDHEDRLSLIAALTTDLEQARAEVAALRRKAGDGQ